MTPSLLPVFRDQLIPWAKDRLSERLIVVQPDMKQARLPEDVQLAHKKISGKRVLVRNQRNYGNQRIVRAVWPDAGLHELAIPKLLCVIAGTTDYRVGHYVLTCSQGHFIFLPPHTPITTSRHSNLEGAARDHGFCDLLQFPLYRDGIQCFLSCSRGQHYFADPHVNFLVRRPQAVEVFRLFFEEVQNEAMPGSQLREYLLAALFSYLLEELQADKQIPLLHHADEFSYAATEHRPPHQSAADIRHYIKTHLPQQLTIEKVAHQTYMSPRQLTRRLRYETGQTFVEMLTQCRLEEARRLLTETAWSISIIAQVVGFSSPAYFNNFFKRYENCSPGTYRRKYGTNDKVGRI